MRVARLSWVQVFLVHQPGPSFHPLGWAEAWAGPAAASSAGPAPGAAAPAAPAARRGPGTPTRGGASRRGPAGGAGVRRCGRTPGRRESTSSYLVIPKPPENGPQTSQQIQRSETDLYEGRSARMGPEDSPPGVWVRGGKLQFRTPGWYVTWKSALRYVCGQKPENNVGFFAIREIDRFQKEI